jgi:hypothetical protein
MTSRPTWRAIASIAALSSIAYASTARLARAEDGESYRGTMVIVDLTSVGALAGASAGESAPGLAVGLAVFALGSPIVHAAHGRWDAAGWALGARVALPAAATLVGCVLAGSGSRTRLGGAFGCLFGGALGGAAGVVTGVILDYVVLAAVDDEATPAMLTYGRSF